MRKRIVIDLRALGWSGIGRYLSENVSRIFHSSPHSFVVFGKESDVKPLISRPSASRVEVRDFPARIFSAREQLLFPALVPRCDLFWLPHFNAPFLPIRAKKAVVTIYDMQPLAQADHRNLLKRAYARLLYSRAFRLADRIITISDFSGREIRRFSSLGEGSLERIYCGIDREFPSGASPQRMSREPYMLFVGNVKANKNLKGALGALLELRSRGAGLPLVIVGKKDGFITPETGLDPLIRSAGTSVIFTGRLSDSDLKAWYRDASLFLFPSLYEGFGLPVLEALSFGLPVVTTREASLPEVGGDLVHYCDGRSPAAIADAITNALNSGRPVASEVKEHLGRFDWDDSARRHLALFDELMGA